MNHYLVECCANSFLSAINGEKGCANRIELCTDLELGGLTPKRSDITKIREVAMIILRIIANIDPRYVGQAYTKI